MLGCITHDQVLHLFVVIVVKIRSQHQIALAQPFGNSHHSNSCFSVDVRTVGIVVTIDNKQTISTSIHKPQSSNPTQRKQTIKQATLQITIHYMYDTLEITIHYMYDTLQNTRDTLHTKYARYTTKHDTLQSMIHDTLQSTIHCNEVDK